MSIQEQLEQVKFEICDKYCKYPTEEGHEDNPDWLFEEGSPCDNCPLNKL